MMTTIAATYDQCRNRGNGSNDVRTTSDPTLIATKQNNEIGNQSHTRSTNVMVSNVPNGPASAAIPPVIVTTKMRRAENDRNKCSEKNCFKLDTLSLWSR